MNFKQTLLTVTAAAGLFAAGSLAANADTVTVKAGDTVSGIALAHHTTVKAIEKANKLADVNFILPGQKLEIDKKGNVKVVEQPQTQAVAQAPVQQQAPQQAPVQQAAQPVQHYQAPVQQYQAPVQQQAAPVRHAASTNNSGSTKDQFLANGGTEALWNTVVMPESGGNPNATSSTGYRGLGQTKEGWGSGSVANQTQGLVNYANSRYGSVQKAVQFHQSNGWW